MIPISSDIYQYLRNRHLQNSFWKNLEDMSWSPGNASKLQGEFDGNHLLPRQQRAFWPGVSAIFGSEQTNGYNGYVYHGIVMVDGIYHKYWICQWIWSGSFFNLGPIFLCCFEIITPALYILHSQCYSNHHSSDVVLEVMIKFIKCGYIIGLLGKSWSEAMVLNPKTTEVSGEDFPSSSWNTVVNQQSIWVCLDMWNTPKDKKYGSLFHYNSLYLFLDKPMLWHIVLLSSHIWMWCLIVYCPRLATSWRARAEECRRSEYVGQTAIVSLSPSMAQEFWNGASCWDLNPLICLY